MFPRIEAAFDVCRRHLDSSRAWGTEIEAIFVGYLLITIHAQFEMEIANIVKRRCVVNGDPHLTAFSGYAVGRLVRKIALSDLTAILNSFSADCKSQFSDRILNSTHHVAYDNIVTNRQSVAHGVGQQMSMIELERAYPISLDVLKEFEAALAPTEPELSSVL